MYYGIKELLDHHVMATISKGELASLYSNIDGLSKKNSKLRSENSSVYNVVSNVKSENEKLLELVQKQKLKIETTEKAFKNINNEIGILRNSKEKCNAEIGLLKDKVYLQARECEALRKKISSIRKKYIALKVPVNIANRKMVLKSQEVGQHKYYEFFDGKINIVQEAFTEFSTGAYFRINGISDIQIMVGQYKKISVGNEIYEIRVDAIDGGLAVISIFKLAG